MANQADVAWTIAGAVFGFAAGVIAALYSILGAGYFFYGAAFPAAAGFALLLGLPVGAALGVKTGARLAQKKRRLFLRVFVPCSILLIAAAIAHYQLLIVPSPRLFTIKITAATSPDHRPARDRTFMARFTTDGVRREVQGTTPSTFTYTASEITYQIEMRGVEAGEAYTVEIGADETLVNREATDFQVVGQACGRGVGWWKVSEGRCDVISRDWKELAD